MSDLGTFQGEFARALLRKPASIAETAATSLDAALTIHRNTCMKGLADALAANYPTVEQLVGREWFIACAIQYAQACPARSPALVLYGETFPMFLAQFAPATELPYLAEVSRIDRLWMEAFAARDASVLTASVLSEMSPAELFEQRVSFHPATRFGWFRHSAVTIWLHHRSARSQSEIDIEDCGEGILLTRAGASVEYAPLDRTGFTFLDRLNAGATLGEATVAALEINAATDIGRRLAQFITSGTFALATGDHR